MSVVRNTNETNQVFQLKLPVLNAGVGSRRNNNPDLAWSLASVYL